jgi:hypothetical protein
MERWLLISNCQTWGLAMSFQMMNENFHVDPVDIWAYRADKKTYDEKMGEYFRVIVSSEFKNSDEIDTTNARHLTYIPSINFSAFHPDITYAGSLKGMIRGVLGDYHSLLVIAAHKQGLSVEDAVALFRGDVFERCGYMDYWEPQRRQLLNAFAEEGIDVSASLRKWSRGRAFMHTVNHPKVHCLYDVARLYMENFGVPIQDAGMPADHLLNGPCWPVYPEIGEALGVRGGYRFQLMGAYRHIGLEAFVRQSYEAYDQHEGGVYPIAEMRPVFNHVMNVVAA